MQPTTQTNRRQFLAMTLTLTSAGTLFLAGCGGSSSNNGGSAGKNFTTRHFTTALPAGFTLPLNTLVAETGKAAANLDASGAFTAQVPSSEVPSLAFLRDKSGRGVLMGFLPTDATPLTPRSAAVALLYYALGGFMLPDASRRPFVALLEADATTVTLGATISQRMLVNPYVLEGDDADINTALKTAFDTLNAGSRAVRTESLSAALTRATRATVDPILQVQPSGLLSNLEVLQGTAATTVTVTNHSRRFCRVYTYQTGTPDALPKAVLQGSPLKLSSTTSLGVFSTINNLVSGQTAYVPVSTDPITLPLASGSTKTLYELIVVGASTMDQPRGFYSDAKYVDEQAKWVQDQADLSTLTWWQNLILPIFFEALGIAGLAAATVAVEGSLAAIKAIEAQSVKALLVNASKGYFLQAVGSFWMVAAENTAAGSTLRAALLPLYEAAVGQLAAETAAARAALFAKLVVRAAVAAVVLIGTGDIAAVLADTTTAQPAEQWFATVFQPTLILDPTAKTIAPGQRVTFTVKPPAGTQGTISYAWTQTGATSTLSSSDGVVGNAITTASTSVDLVTTASDSGTITVKVVATLTDAGGHKSELGTAQAIMTLDSSVSYSNATEQIVEVTYSSGPNAGKSALFAGFSFAVPSGPWLYAQLESLQDPSDLSVGYIPLGPYLARQDYDAGAALFTEGGTGYGYARNGNGNYVNLGGATVGYFYFGTSIFDPGTDESAFYPAAKKELDKFFSPRVRFYSL